MLDPLDTRSDGIRYHNEGGEGTYNKGINYSQFMNTKA